MLSLTEMRRAVKLAMNIATGKTVTVYVVNSLDQEVTVQVKGNRANSTPNASNVGSSFTVSASSSDFRTLIPDTTGITPYIYVEVSCSVTPTSGNVIVYLDDGEGESTLIDSLEIRDTNTHDPSDTEISILSWWW